MARIRGDGLKPETELARALEARGNRLERNARDLPGTPDIVLREHKVAVFVHGCFWHGCRRHHRLPKTNRRFWREKLESNRLRDERVRRRLRALGWRTVVVWEHEVRRDPQRAARRVERRADWLEAMVRDGTVIVPGVFINYGVAA